MRRLTFFWIMMMSCLPLLLRAQGQAVVSGTVTDRTLGEPLPAATVGIAPASDTSAKTYTSTDGEGAFAFRAMAVGDYVVSVSYVGYKPMEKRLKVTDKKQAYTLNFVLEEDAQVLGEVSVQGRATRAEQQGDSLKYNAEAFQVMEGSSAEDLLAKMPGIVVEGGTVQAQGEQVQKVLVDGKEFFDGDVNLAIKNLPSDIIASIEVFDKKSEQAEFTGFDDGEEVKTSLPREVSVREPSAKCRVATERTTDIRLMVTSTSSTTTAVSPCWACRTMSTSRTSRRKTWQA